MNPKFCIIASAHRPQNWMNLYKSIGDNKVDFELVFVGPNPPDYELPKNFRFIRSLVKPAQCFEIAYRNTTAELVMYIADDCTFETSRPLDRFYEMYKSYNNDKIIFSCKYLIDGKEQSSGDMYFHLNDINTPKMAVSGVMSRQLFTRIGGIDRNFIGLWWDCDIFMRVHALGGDVVYSDVLLNEDKGKSSANSALSLELAMHDRGLLEYLWVKDGKVNLFRAKPVESFSDLNILTASQGPRGRWRGNGPLFFDKVEDKWKSMFGYGSTFARVHRGIRKPSMYLNYVKRIASHVNWTVTKNNDRKDVMNES